MALTAMNYCLHLTYFLTRATNYGLCLTYSLTDILARTMCSTTVHATCAHDVIVFGVPETTYVGSENMMNHILRSEQYFCLRI